MTAIHHSLDVYGVELYLATTKREWSALRRNLTFLKAEQTDNGGLSAFAVWEPKQGPAVPHVAFWINLADHDPRDPADLIDTCAHEASHAAGQILEHIGHTFTGTDEPHAYLTGWLTRWLWRHCDERTAA